MNKEKISQNNAKCILLGCAIWLYIRLRAVLFCDEINKVKTLIMTYRWSSGFLAPTGDFVHRTKSGRARKRETLPNISMISLESPVR